MINKTLMINDVEISHSPLSPFQMITAAVVLLVLDPRGLSAQVIGNLSETGQSSYSVHTSQCRYYTVCKIHACG